MWDELLGYFSFFMDKRDNMLKRSTKVNTRGGKKP